MTNGIVIVGGGGHAKVCIELLLDMGESVAFCVASEDGPSVCGGIPVLRGDDHLLRLRREGFTKAFVAIGSNEMRDHLAREVVGSGYNLVNAVSPHAIISPSARLGIGIAIMAGAVVNAEASISDMAIINTGATVDHDCVIGRAAHIGPQCGLAGNVEVGQRSLLGVGCSVIPQRKIGSNVTIGAGAVVVADIPDDSTVVGVPARILEPKQQR